MKKWGIGFALLLAALFGACGEVSDNTEKAEALGISGPVELFFSSGAGGWYTAITLQADGSFRGEHRDNDYGDSGENYDITVYKSSFSGRFSLVEKISEEECSLKLVSLAYEEEPGTVTLTTEDGVTARYIATEAYGLTGGKEFRFYAPGKQVSGLNEDFLNWVHLSGEDSVLPFYALHNLSENEGFAGP